MGQNKKKQTSKLKSGEESKSSSVPENSEVFYGKERELDKKIKKKIQKAMEEGQKDLMKEGGRIVETAGKLVDEIIGTDGEMKEEDILKLMGELEDEAEELGEKIPEAKEKTKKMILEVLSRVEGCLRDMAEYVKAKKDGVSDKTASILVKPVEWIEKLKVKGKNLKEEAKLMFEGLKDGQWKEKVKTFGSKVGGSMKKGYEYVKETSKIAYQSAVYKTKSFAKKVGDFVQETLKLDL